MESKALFVASQRERRGRSSARLFPPSPPHLFFFLSWCASTCHSFCWFCQYFQSRSASAAAPFLFLFPPLSFRSRAAETEGPFGKLDRYFSYPNNNIYLKWRGLSTYSCASRFSLQLFFFFPFLSFLSHYHKKFLPIPPSNIERSHRKEKNGSCHVTYARCVLPSHPTTLPVLGREGNSCFFTSIFHDRFPHCCMALRLLPL